MVDISLVLALSLIIKVFFVKFSTNFNGLSEPVCDDFQVFSKENTIYILHLWFKSDNLHQRIRFDGYF